jgi:hypothetical protein
MTRDEREIDRLIWVQAICLGAAPWLIPLLAAMVMEAVKR